MLAPLPGSGVVLYIVLVLWLVSPVYVLSPLELVRVFKLKE